MVPNTFALGTGHAHASVVFEVTADFSSVRIFCDCVKRSVASSMALCTTETIQMDSPQQLEST